MSELTIRNRKVADRIIEDFDAEIEGEAPRVINMIDLHQDIITALNSKDSILQRYLDKNAVVEENPNEGKYK